MEKISAQEYIKRWREGGRLNVPTGVIAPKLKPMELKGLVKFINVLDLDNVTESVRKLSREELARVYASAAANQAIDIPPEKMKQIIDGIEAELYKNYKNNGDKYMLALTRLLTFINPQNYIGQFAKLFRTKVLQDVYTPARLMALDITDLLPEIFINPNVSPSDKLYLYQNINNSVTSGKNIQASIFNDSLNPTFKSQRKFPNILRQISMQENLVKKTHPVKKLCFNPFWNIKEVNIIICKEDKRFYCLDIQELIKELGEKGTATNKFTGKPLNPEVKVNLNKRYEKEIAEYKKSRKDPIVGKRTSAELEDLRGVVKELRRFKKSLELKKIETIGDVPQIIPEQTREKFAEWFNDQPLEEVIPKIGIWVDKELENIQSITGPVAEEPEPEPKPVIPPAGPVFTRAKKKKPRKKLLKLLAPKESEKEEEDDDIETLFTGSESEGEEESPGAKLIKELFGEDSEEFAEMPGIKKNFSVTTF